MRPSSSSSSHGPKLVMLFPVSVAFAKCAGLPKAGASAEGRG